MKKCYIKSKYPQNFLKGEKYEKKKKKIINLLKKYK